MVFSFHDRKIDKLMKDSIKKYYLKNIIDTNRDEQVREIFGYKTRLGYAATVETIIIWRANKGFWSAIRSEPALQIKTTIRSTFHESDMLDKDDDEYNPEVLKYKQLTPNERERRLHLHELYTDIRRNLKDFIFKRFDKFHPNIKRIYEIGRKEVEHGQEDDKKLRINCLKGNFEQVRSNFFDEESRMQLIKRKLGSMGGYTAKMTFVASGRDNEDLQNTLASFWTNAAVLMHYWVNDVRKLPEDIVKQDTNALITSAICQYHSTLYDKKLIRKFLREYPEIVDNLSLPYYEELKKDLKQIEKFRLNISDHKAIVRYIEKKAKEEKANLFKNLELL